MQRLRTHWLALLGAILVLTLTVSATFAAPPEGNRGQTIAAFVHDLVLGDVETDEDADQEDEDTEGDTDEDLEEDTEEDTEGDAAREVPAEFANHGECVSEAANKATSAEDESEADLDNHGAWVSMHARYTCWGLEPPTEEPEEGETTGDGTESDGQEDTDADKLAAREQAKADREAARAERQAEREAARAEREAAKAAQQQLVETSGRSNGNGGGGNGNGRGGGKP